MDLPPMTCARCGGQLPPHGTLDKLTRVGDILLCFLCLHAYAEAALIHGIRPGPVRVGCSECGMAHAPGQNTLCTR